MAKNETVVPTTKIRVMDDSPGSARRPTRYGTVTKINLFKNGGSELQVRWDDGCEQWVDSESVVHVEKGEPGYEKDSRR